MEELTFAQQFQQFLANHPVMIAAWIAIFAAVIVSVFKGATSKIKVVDNAGLTALINNEDGVVLDIRSDEEFKSGHIIDSHHIYPTDIKTGKVQGIEKYKDRPVIVADNNGLTAQSNANALFKLGFSKAYALKDGINGWRGANLPLVKKHK